MPLMWAHAEYIKLLRSVRDGRVFDLIPTVADRYLRKRGRKDIEVWKPVRQVRRVRVGQTLRIQAPRPFQLHWSRDDWQSAQDTDSSATLLGIHFLDIPVTAPQTTPIRFTFLWRDNTRWEGRDYKVAVEGKSASESK